MTIGQEAHRPRLALGPTRNDNRKEHPDLVPYSELSESEKDYDRKTVTEVLKTVIAFGYDIKRRPRRPTGMWLRGKCRQVPYEKTYKMKLDRPVQVCEPPIASACAPEDRQN